MENYPAYKEFNTVHKEFIHCSKSDPGPSWYSCFKTLTYHKVLLCRVPTMQPTNFSSAQKHLPISGNP